jgi:hypothetical protein
MKQIPTKKTKKTIKYIRKTIVLKRTTDKAALPKKKQTDAKTQINKSKRNSKLKAFKSLQSTRNDIQFYMANTGIKNIKNTKINKKNIKCHFKTTTKKKGKNKTQKIINGNITKGNLKIISWNKGSGLLINRIGEITSLIEREQPHLLALQELQLRKQDDLFDVHIPGYSLEFDQLMVKYNVARTGFYISNSVNYVRRKELENKINSSVWITLKLPGVKPLNVNTFYRQWKCPKDPNLTIQPDTLHINQQVFRLSKHLDSCKLAQKEDRECLLLSDSNLNSQEWFNNHSTLSLSNKKLIPLFTLWKEQLLQKGFVTFKTAPTRRTVNNVETTLDHLHTIHPHLIINHQVQTNGASDHRALMFIRSGKGIKNSLRYFTTRIFKNFDSDKFSLDMSQDPRYLEILKTKNSNFAYDTLHQLLQDTLKKSAPITKIQVKQIQPNFLTEDTKLTETSRNQALISAQNTDSQDDWRNYKHLKNLTHHKYTRDKKLSIKTKIQKALGDKDMWKTSKEIMGWKTTKTPTLLVNKGKMITSTLEIARVLNMEFIFKVNDIRRNIPKTSTNPLLNYRRLIKKQKNK